VTAGTPSFRAGSSQPTTDFRASPSRAASSAVSSTTSRPPPSSGTRMTMPRPSLVTSSGPSPVRGFIAAILPSPSSALRRPTRSGTALHRAVTSLPGTGGGTGQPQPFLSVALLSRVRKQNGNDRPSCWAECSRSGLITRPFGAAPARRAGAAAARRSGCAGDAAEQVPRGPDQPGVVRSAVTAETLVEGVHAGVAEQGGFRAGHVERARGRPGREQVPNPGRHGVARMYGAVGRRGVVEQDLVQVVQVPVADYLTE